MAKLKRLQIKSNGMFQNWPVIDYDGQQMQKLTTKITMPSFIKNNTQVFFNYTIRSHDYRPDVVASKMYGDKKLDWVVLFFNNIIDPSFEWPMNNVVFEQFIIDKYGSVALAQSTVRRYKQAEQKENISAATYDALSTNLQKYWVKQLDQGGNIIDYRYLDSNYEISPLGYAALSGESAYWDEISAYDEEVNKNEARKVIRLIQPAYLSGFLSQYRRTLG